MGLLSAAGSAPILLVGLFAGVWVDRLRRRPLMIAADVGRAALLLLIPLAAAAGALRMETLYVVALSTGALSVLFDVAYLSLLPTLVDRDELVEANGKIEVTASVAQVVGPGLGGTLLGTLGAAAAVMVDAVSFLVSALFLRRIPATEPRPAVSGERQGVRAEIVEGLHAVAHHRILRALAVCSASRGSSCRRCALYASYRPARAARTAGRIARAAPHHRLLWIRQVSWSDDSRSYGRPGRAWIRHCSVRALPAAATRDGGSSRI